MQFESGALEINMDELIRDAIVQVCVVKHDTLLRSVSDLLCSQLVSEDAHDCTDAARLLFEMAHTSHPNSEHNKTIMGTSGAVPALCRLLRYYPKSA
jgi:hypothetical protein